MNNEPPPGRVAFLGLGAMGSAMARTLLSAGVDLVVWNRSAAATEPLAQEGASVAATPDEAVNRADTVISMLSDDSAMETVMLGPKGAIDAMRADTLHMAMSTISAASADRWEVAHGERGLLFISAPVFGRPQAAAAGALYTVTAGASVAVARAEALLAILGQRNFIVGDRPAQACAVKLAGNFMIMAATEAMGEALAVAGTAGVPPDTTLDVLTHSLFDTPLYHAYGAMLVQQRFKPAGFTAQLGLKDMELFNELADPNGVSAPFLDVIRERLHRVIDRHGADCDWAAVGNMAREDTEDE